MLSRYLTTPSGGTDCLSMLARRHSIDCCLRRRSQLQYVIFLSLYLPDLDGDANVYANCDEHHDDDNDLRFNRRCSMSFNWLCANSMVLFKSRRRLARTASSATALDD